MLSKIYRLAVPGMLLVALMMVTNSNLAWSAADGSQKNTEQEEQEQSQRVARFHGSLISIMQSSASVRQRFEKLQPIVADLFDVQRVARISIGRTWKNLSVDEQKSFVDKLTDLIAATYAERFSSYEKQSFETLSVGHAKRGWVIKTRLVKTDGGNVSLNYYLNKVGVYNVVADGVSDLSLRRADYNSIVKSQGYPALVAHISDQFREQLGLAGENDG